METEGQGVEQTQRQDGISYEDAQALISQTAEEVAASYYEHEREADATYAADLQSLGDALSGDIKALSSGVDALSAKEDSKAGETVVVVLDSSQWAEIQKCWGWAKAGAQVGVYLALVCTLMVCAILGTRLWGSFSKGWRK